MLSSRIGRQPVLLPSGVSADVADGEVRVQGPKGRLAFRLPTGVAVRRVPAASGASGSLVVETVGGTRLKDRDLRARHGLARALIRNMVLGVTSGFSRKIELVGAGYRPTVQGQALSLSLGFSHPIAVPLPEGIKVAAEKLEAGARGEERHSVTISGCDKALVGQIAANLRALKKADVYKGKGVRYAGEAVRRKAGKAAATAAGTAGVK